MTDPTSQPHGLDIELKKKKRWPWIAAAVAVVVAIAGGVSYATLANQDKPFGTTLDVATWSTDIAAENLLSYIATNVAPDHGITINPVKIDNLIEINRAVDAGNVAGNFFEHQPFLNDAIADNGFDKLTLAAPTFTGSGDVLQRVRQLGTRCPAAPRSPCATTRRGQGDRPAQPGARQADHAEAGQGKNTLEGLPSSVTSPPIPRTISSFRFPSVNWRAASPTSTRSSCTSPTSTRPG